MMLMTKKTTMVAMLVSPNPWQLVTGALLTASTNDTCVRLYFYRSRGSRAALNGFPCSITTRVFLLYDDFVTVGSSGFVSLNQNTNTTVDKLKRCTSPCRMHTCAWQNVNWLAVQIIAVVDKSIDGHSHENIHSITEWTTNNPWCKTHKTKGRIYIANNNKTPQNTHTKM